MNTQLDDLDGLDVQTGSLLAPHSSLDDPTLVYSLVIGRHVPQDQRHVTGLDLMPVQPHPVLKRFVLIFRVRLLVPVQNDILWLQVRSVPLYSQDGVVAGSLTRQDDSLSLGRGEADLC